MSLKKASPPAQPSALRNDLLQARLEYLYTRRIVVTNLIRSLEAYTAARPENDVIPSTDQGYRLAS